MKICIYGSQGHVNTAFDSLKDADDIRVSAICCEPREEIDWLKGSLTRMNMNFRVYAEFEEMIDNEKPDISVISSYPDKNARAVNYALNRDIHVFCEKPIVINPADFDEIKKTLQKSSAKLYSMMTERFVPAFYTAYKAVIGGLIGTVRLVDSRKSYKLGVRPDYYKSRKTYAGTLSWVGIHAIDRIYWMSGKKIETVFAHSSNRFNSGNGDLEMTAICSFVLADDVLASFTCDYYRPAAAETHGDDRVRVVGTDGIIEIMDGKVSYINENQSVCLPLLKTPGIFDEFLQYVKTGQSSFLTSEDCLYTTYVALKTMEASDTGSIIHLR